jgi:hypothetical protein
VVKTKAVSDKSRVFVTLKTLLNVPLAVTHIDNGKSFTAEVKAPITEPAKFDWLIVEEK